MKWGGLGLAILLLASGVHAELPGEWQYVQQLEVSKPGLVKFSLPLETLDAARPGLEDLRLYDLAGSEVPYYLEMPARPEPVRRRVAGFAFSLTHEATIISLDTGLTRPLEGIALETGAKQFIKGVKIEGSVDKQHWQVLATGLPVFRQPGEAGELTLKVPPGVWPYLKLTVDDRRSGPVTFTGAELLAAAPPVPVEPLPVSISQRLENDQQTRLTVNLGAKNLTLAGVRVEASDPLFMRRLTAADYDLADNEIREIPLAAGNIYRIGVEGAAVSAKLSLPLERQIKSRELLLLIDNQDNPPLKISAVVVQRQPVFVTFFCPQPGTYRLLVGNARSPAPRYDLASLATNLREAPLSSLTLSPLADNPFYRPVAALPEIQDLGTALDLSGWRFRKPVQLRQAGVISFDLDLEALAGADPDCRDLRLVRDGKQQPYILERTSINRKLAPKISPDPDPQKPSMSRWRLAMPYKGLPITALTCASPTPLFQRVIFLYEQPTDYRGEKYRRPLGKATWLRRPPAGAKSFELKLERRPLTDQLILETDNGDNPPIELENVQLVYQLTRLLFKAPASSETYLFYGNKEAGLPRYDLALMASELLTAEKVLATLGPEEKLPGSGWGEALTMTRTGSMFFWIALAVVVVVLLAAIARLLPKSPPPQ
jgi:Protein of unknown function (DUF3999)